MNEHQLVYPYQNFEAKEQLKYSDIVENALVIQDYLLRENNGNGFETEFDSILGAIRYVQENFYLDCASSTFLDCFGASGSGALFASAFGWKTVQGIDMSEDGFEVGRKIMRELKKEKLLKCSEMILKCGSMNDYFLADASMVYCNCSVISNSTMIDEAAIIAAFFRICRQLLPGSFLVIVPFLMRLDSTGLKSFGRSATNVRYIYHFPIKSKGNYNDSNNGPVAWILQTTTTKS